MQNNEKSICYESAVWDLHIHTCECPKASGDFKNLSVEDYLDILDGIFQRHKDLQMISFTDHNFISSEVYKKAKIKWPSLSIIIGIEVDTFLDSDDQKANKYKHVIYYFDPDKFDINNHAKQINSKLSNKPILLNDFLNFLLTEIKTPFLISPHFMKQEPRDIQCDWNDEVSKHIDKYIDQMFCFWETSSAITINRAEQFLKDFDRGDRVSIIAFSDSNSKDKLEDYLNNPSQYFNSLPSFNGMRMVGSDCGRIKRQKQIIKSEDKPLYIGRVEQGENNIIYFSDRLNAIIGGRGMGKSLLLDGIAYCIDPKYITENEQLSERKTILSELDYKVFDLNGNPLRNHQNFEFEFFNQGYALQLFNRKNDESVEKNYFKKEFSQIEDFDLEVIKSKIKEDITYIKTTPLVEQDNLAALCQKIILLKEKETSWPLKKQKIEEEIEYKEAQILLDSLTKSAIVNKELKTNPNILKKCYELISTIYTETFKYNNKCIQNNFHGTLYDQYTEVVNNKTALGQTKNKTLKLFKNKLVESLNPFINRISRINAILSDTTNYSNVRTYKTLGFGANRFVFTKELKVQPLLKYLHNVFASFFDSRKLKSESINRDDFNDLFKMIEVYCYSPSKYLLDSKTLDELEMELDSLDSLEITNSFEVYYVESDKKPVKLRTVSPGTRANLLLEYIVFKSTNIPLLIDQPEDNIDNRTIYSLLTTWFTDLKCKRQVIVATHDANIVVNADAENVIVCSQTDSSIFDYKTGALEYSDIINDVSTILDGGSDALERRLAKYGK